MHDGNVLNPTQCNKRCRNCSSVNGDDEYHLLSNRMTNLNEMFTSVSELVEHLRGNNGESVNAAAALKQPQPPLL